MKSDFRSKGFKRNSVEFFFCLQLSEKPDEKLYCGWLCDELAAHPEGSTDTPCSGAHFTFLLIFNYMIFKNFWLQKFCQNQSVHKYDK